MRGHYERRTNAEREADLWRSWQRQYEDAQMVNRARHTLDLARPERYRAVMTGVEVKLRRHFTFFDAMP